MDGGKANGAGTREQHTEEAVPEETTALEPF